MIKTGITGGIGSGKSIVSEVMKVMNIPVYNADEASKNILKTNMSVQEQLRETLGESIFSGGELNKAQMASLIFNNPDLLAKVNAIIHPAVFDDFERWCNNHRNQAIVACEAAIIFESGMNRFLDYVIMVSAPIQLSVERAMQRDNVTEQQIMTRIKNQLPDEEKIKLADFTVINDNRQAVIPQVREILYKIFHYFK